MATLKPEIIQEEEYPSSLEKNGNQLQLDSSKELKLLISPEPERPKPDAELKDKILKLYRETSDNNLKETDFQPLGRTSLFHILRACAASKRNNLRGLDNITAEGVDSYTELHRLIDQLKDLGLMSLDVHSEISTKLTASRVYMKTDYKLHVEQSSLCADHCIDWSLSDPSDKDFQNTCQHKHTLKCDRCELIKEVELQLNSVIDALHVTQEAHRTYCHVMDSAKQDWFTVSSLLENSLDTIKKQMPFIKEVMLRSDNAGCYHCGQLWFSLLQISQRTGISITEYCYSEPQAGKSYCDSTIAHMRMKMKSYAASGHNILTAADMKHALDAGSGVKGCQVANVAINTTKQLFTMHKMKNVNNYSSITYQKEWYDCAESL
uniref:Uncharacterized protein n=1 Tax=Magallana gigas TaxID=29159 RepID=A0A8W8MNA2_MAGGI